MEKLNINDLIVEYMAYKVRNDYDPIITTKEFTKFLKYFEEKIEVEKETDNIEEIFKSFYDTKNKKDWLTPKWIDGKKEYYSDPHMYLKNDGKDYYLEANYNLNINDLCRISTYNMFNEDVTGIRILIGEFLANQRKRSIKESFAPDASEWMVGCSAAANIINEIWKSYINEDINNQRWPKQCQDINKYLFDIDLSSIIGTKSIKEELCNAFDAFSKRIAILYHTDKNLKISSDSVNYLAYSNYRLLIDGYKELIEKAYDVDKKELELDFSKLTYREIYEEDKKYYFDSESYIMNNVKPIENEKAKTLVHNMYKRKKIIGE